MHGDKSKSNEQTLRRRRGAVDQHDRGWGKDVPGDRRRDDKAPRQADLPATDAEVAERPPPARTPVLGRGGPGGTDQRPPPEPVECWGDEITATLAAVAERGLEWWAFDVKGARYKFHLRSRYVPPTSPPKQLNLI